MNVLLKYFPDLSATQLVQFEQLLPLYQSWNEKINVISRKDIDQLYERHVLHSLSIAKFIRFKSGSQILDLGTGGGFPGIPLAIFFPDVQFTLCDSIGKKIKVVDEISTVLKLQNVRTHYGRAEEMKKQFDFVVTRAVAELEQLIRWSQKLIFKKSFNSLPNGLIVFKGGDVQSEVKKITRHTQVHAISECFDEEYFSEKYLIHVSL